MLLTPEEIRDLTEYKRPHEQIRWLREHGYPFELGASGRPKVLRSEVERRLGRAAKGRAAPHFEHVGKAR